uniref:Ig-like domain-containing protein n=1 Tax=Neolamprologus brichardi TaxID=32507 RepID=A0A3Q4I1N3_NEOBR
QVDQQIFIGNVLKSSQRLTITCQVSYSLGNYRTAWIRQPAGKGLEWIGMKYTGDSFYKDSLKNKFSIDLDTSSKAVTLNGQNMQPEDTAVYYCARESQSHKPSVELGENVFYIDLKVGLQQLTLCRVSHGHPSNAQSTLQ